MSFQTRGAVAILACPVLGAVEIAASAAGVSILYFLEIEILLPVRPFFLKRRWTVADFHPLERTVIQLPGFRHIAEVFISGDRTSAESSILNRLFQRRFPAGLDSGGDEISHNRIVLL